MKIIELNEQQFFNNIVNEEDFKAILNYDATHYLNQVHQLALALAVAYDYLGFNINFEYIKLNADNTPTKFRASFIVNNDTFIRVLLNDKRFVILVYPSMLEIACDTIKELATRLHNLNLSATTIERVSSL